MIDRVNEQSALNRTRSRFQAKASIPDFEIIFDTAMVRRETKPNRIRRSIKYQVRPKAHSSA